MTELVEMDPKHHGILSRSTDPPISAFDVLFSGRVRGAYETAREIIAKKWTNRQDYQHTEVCSVCLLRAKAPSVDITLLNLFYSCSTLTQNLILDAITCLHFLYGWNACQDISPKDVYFHFFLHHCDTKKSSTDFHHKAYISDFVCKMLHSIVFDFPEIDELANFVTTIANEAYAGCVCNTSKQVLSTIQEGGEDALREGGGAAKFGRNARDGGVDDDEDDDDDGGLFVPADIADTATTTRVRWENSYKWDYTPPVQPDPKQPKDGADDDVTPLAVNCLRAFHNCKVCNAMMCLEKHEKLSEIAGLVSKYRESTNVSTAVVKACRVMRMTAEETEDMRAHYESPECEFNRLKFIHFYSLVKQPSSLMNPVAAQHLFLELFSTKKSYLCPTYHLACLCDTVAREDKSNLKSTKRHTIQKWSQKMMDRHRPEYTAMRRGVKAPKKLQVP